MEFNTLTSIDTVYSPNTLKKYERIDSLNKNNYFFSYKDKEYKSGLLLIKRKQSNWIVYDFEISSYLGPNGNIISFHKENERFLSIQTSKSPSGMCSNTYGFLILLDIKNPKIISYCNYNHQQCYDTSSGTTIASQSDCIAKYEISEDFLKVRSTKKQDDGLNCIESAEYKIEENRLIKTKYYSYLTQQLQPVLCVQNICTGTKIGNLKKSFPNLNYKDIPMFAYGYDSDEQGIEFYQDGLLKFFVTISDNIINGISIISPEYNLNGINTESSISQIFRKYPNVKLNIDLISDWEFVYLKNEKIKFVFKTDKANRIGIYGEDFESGTRKMKREDAEIDFIQL